MKNDNFALLQTNRNGPWCYFSKAEFLAVVEIVEQAEKDYQHPELGNALAELQRVRDNCREFEGWDD